MSPTEEEHPAGTDDAEAGADGTDEAQAPAFEDQDPTGEFDLRQYGEEAAAERAQQRGSLTVRRSAGNEVDVVIDRPEMVIGRDTACDIVLTDPSVSRRHAVVRRQDAGHFEVRDLGSRNGTLVGGLPVEQMLLLNGDKFSVGNVRLTLNVLAG